MTTSHQTEMASIIFAERENASLHTPALKMRQRLISAPENLLKTPLTGKKLHVPLQSGRKALGVVNKITSTPTVNGQEKNKLLETQETKVKTLPQTKVKEYPDIERFIPYDPLEFEKYVIPEDVVCLSQLALPGLGCLPQMPYLPEEDFEVLETYTRLSPLKDLRRADNCATELDAFLQTINELTIDLPLEMNE
ncbi:securin isoform X1 [Coregonus clupeaformis]|uniref:securin isoform X1 n=1 Tax=Coregonus clupeaformis TaxID=59861 RepID=UPI001BE058E5|nr:securin isoform X1 [Coregonus clupeaformis]